jgi:hypothetical protein
MWDVEVYSLNISCLYFTKLGFSRSVFLEQIEAKTTNFEVKRFPVTVHLNQLNTMNWQVAINFIKF